MRSTAIEEPFSPAEVPTCESPLPQQCGRDHSLGYPGGDNDEGWAFLETAAITRVDGKTIAHSNAGRLLHMPPASVRA